MSKANILSILAIIVVVFGAGFLIFKSHAPTPTSVPPTSISPSSPTSTSPSSSTSSSKPKPAPTPVACSMEAKLCPDGSYVSRTGPNCEFAACPGASNPQKSGINGTVTMGPSCPVNPVPPDPNCAPKPYSTSISIMKAGTTNVIKIIQTDANGAFSIELNPGVYTLQAQGGEVLPRCSPIAVEVKTGQYANGDIFCDTGIR